MFKIGKRVVSINNPTYFIAEIGSNFDGDLNRALDLIKLAKDSGADAVKFQHYTAASLVSDEGFKSLGGKSAHQKEWKKSVFETYEKASLNKEWTSLLHKECLLKDIEFLTSPYSLDLIDYVSPFLNAFKIGSGDINWHAALEKAGEFKKPILIGTGASNLQEVKDAVHATRLDENLVCIMQCNTSYTLDESNFDYANLNVIDTYKKTFPNSIIGLSCHLKDHLSVLIAVSKGARIIEKHFTDDNERIGPDHKFALNPIEFKSMVENTRKVERLLGDGVKKKEDNEIETSILQRRALCTRRNLKIGDIIQASDLEPLRPAPKDSFNAQEISKIASKKATKDLVKGKIILKEDFE